MTLSQVSQPRRIEAALEHIRNETTDRSEAIQALYPSEFTDPNSAAAERDLVFGRVPSIVAHVSEVSVPGDSMTVQLPRHTVRITRQPDGLIGASVAGAHPKVALPCEVRHGLVWIIDNPEVAIDVESWLGAEMDEILRACNLENLIVYKVEGFQEAVNWKILQDAFIDNYHIQYAHPNTAGKHVHTNVQTVEDFGRHVRMTTPRKSIDRWIEEDPGEHQLARDIIEGHFLLPNSTLLGQPDHYQLLTFRPHPTDPGRGCMEMRLVVPKLEDTQFSEESWNRRWTKNWDILMAVLMNEDLPLLRGSQVGVSSADAGQLLLGRNEIVNQIFRRELHRLVN